MYRNARIAGSTKPLLPPLLAAQLLETYGAPHLARNEAAFHLHLHGFVALDTTVAVIDGRHHPVMASCDLGGGDPCNYQGLQPVSN